MNRFRRAGLLPAKHLDRYRHIAEVLADEGLHVVIDASGLGKLAPRRKSGRAEPDHLTTEQHARRAIERLGVTFIKGGQALSTRTDIVPTALAAELRKLQDEVTPEPFETVRQVVEGDLEQPLSAVFPVFETEPFASASIGQVHRAELPDGTPVAVKVQRPGVREQVEVDLDITLTQAQWVADHVFEFADLDVVGIATEFADAVRQIHDHGIRVNLLLNAVEAMMDGGIIHIETSINPTDPSEVEILIEDTGRGIPPSQRRHIFEPFVSTKENGTGLGLTVSYGIINAHGGSLDLVDRRRLTTNRGACFRITLPIAEHT